MTALKVMGIALGVGGLLLWMATIMPARPTFTVSEKPKSAYVMNPLVGGEDGFHTLQGLVIYDNEVPYILYERQEGGVRTKQLVFASRGCSTSAGDIPCAGGERDSALTVPAETRILVSGFIEGDQILVNSFQIL